MATFLSSQRRICKESSMGITSSQAVTPVENLTTMSSHRKVSMATIVPAPVRPQSTRSLAVSSMHHIRNTLDPTLGIGLKKQRGRYSIERALALREYTQRTSRTRAVLVCCLTPVPALVLSLAIECIPLASPSLPWDQQGMFWIRLLLTATVMGLLSGVNFKRLAGRALELGLLRLVGIAVLTSSLYVGFFMGIAAAWTFPIPFLFVIGGVPFVFFQVLSAFALVDIRTMLAKAQGLTKRTEGINAVSAAVSVLYWVYPLYTVAFEAVGPKYQVPLLLVLPFFKAQWKKHMCLKLDQVEDLIPTIMMFTIELFNALYLANCMQASGSAMATAVIIVLDIALSLVRVYRLRTQMNGLLTTISATKLCRGENDLLHFFINRVCDPSTPLHEGELGSARIRGNGLDQELSCASIKILCTLEDKRNAGEQLPRQQPSSDIATLDQTLQFLFECEFIVLAEYIECAIPLLYGIYLPIMHSLHNGLYFGHIHALSTDALGHAVTKILVYYALESISFAAMMLWLKRHFAVSMVHLLAFVLDQQFVYVQGNVLLQMLFALQFTIAHLGADFSFKFAWIKDPKITWWIKQ